MLLPTNNTTLFREKLIADRQIKEQQEREYRESAERDKRRILEAKKVRQEMLEAEEKERKRKSDTEARRKVWQSSLVDLESLGVRGPLFTPRR